MTSTRLARCLSGPPPSPILALAAALGLAASGSPTTAASMPIEHFELHNGMTFLVVPRPGAPMTAAAWVVRAGSADERPGETGLAHLLEHLMFKGTRIIGTRDIDRELPLLEREDRLRTELRELELGAATAARHERRRRELDVELRRLAGELRSLVKSGEYAFVYTREGAVGIDALTSEDLTLYYMQLPSNKAELWFWMESDRLLHPVFRQFYQELEIIDEERRQRVESIPAGAERELFRRRFWHPQHPYSWPPIGRREDLAQLSRAQAEAFFATHYRPGNLIAALVGDVEPAQVRGLAERYFGRLPAAGAGPTPSPPLPRSSFPEMRPDVRMESACDCPSQVAVRYRTVPFGHPDSYSLDALAGVLGGRSGRLHRGFVLERGIAFSAEVLHNPRRRDGDFSIRLVARGGATPAQLEAAWYGELERLLAEPVTERELEKTKNQAIAEAYHRLGEPLEMAMRLLAYGALGNWRHLEQWPQHLQAVGSEDLLRAARTYLVAERRGVARFERRKEAGR